MSTSFYCPGGRRGVDGRFEVECNFSSASSVLLLIGEAPTLSGHWEGPDLSRVQSRIIRAMNVRSDRQPFIEEPREDHRVTWGGCSDEQLLGRLAKLQDLVKHAQDNCLQIFWG
jgi:hypothetical protein